MSNATPIRFEVSPTEAIQQIKRCMYHYFVPILMSSPGMGKSALHQQIAKDMNLKLIDLRTAHMDTVEFNGYPDLAGDYAVYKTIEMLPTPDMQIPEGYDGWLIFFDELPQAVNDVQGALHKVILDRMVGMNTLHEKAFCVAAGNYATDRAASKGLITSLQSRLHHLHLRNSLNDFMPYMIGKKFSTQMIAFLNFKPDMLNNFDPSHTEDTFACQRTWDKLNTLFPTGVIEEADLPLAAGTVGATAATQYHAFSEVWKNLPELDTIENNPSTATVPDSLQTQFALVSKLAIEVDPDNADAFAEYVSRLPSEMQLLFTRTAIPANFELMQIASMQNLLQKFSEQMQHYV